MKYLNNFASLIPALQGSKAIRKVEELRQIGEIQTEAEYQAKLSAILSTFSTQDFSPTFKYIPFKAGISSSEQYNEMMNQIRDDLEVAFTEINNIYIAIQAHDLIFKDKLVNELNAAVDELEKEIDRLTIVASDNNSFDEVFINTFTGEANRLVSTDRYANELLYDRRMNKKMADEFNLHIDSDEQTASLPLVSQNIIHFAEASVRQTDSTSTDYDVQVQDSNLQNILTAQAGSGWAYNILKINPLTDGARLSLELNLGDKRLVNYLIINPIADFPVVLDSIQYINENEVLTTLPNDSLFGSALNNSVKISFDDLIAKRFILSFSQRSSSLFSYNTSVSSITMDDLRRDQELVPNAQIIKDQIQAQVQNIDLLSVLPISANPTPAYQVLYQYIFGFTSIFTGLDAFKTNGYFVSKPYSKNTPALIAINAEQDDAKYTNPITETEESVGSFEYSIVKKDYNGRGELVQAIEFPILPLNQLSVANERLFFTPTSTVSSLRFSGHGSDNMGSGVQIYRNNVLLVRGPDWRFADRANVGDNADDELKPGLYETRIEIRHDSNLIKTGIYTANYQPRHIAEPNNIISNQGVTYLSSNATEHSVDIGSSRIEKSDLFLKVCIRNNTFYSNKSPKLNFYKIFASSVDSSKYVRL